jgi:FKBP-type peptidyl-prolyl cis-trans isomerase
MNRTVRITSLVIGAAVVAAACGPRLARAVVTPSGLTYTIVEKGKGPSAKPGNYVTIEETTALADGRVHFTTDGRKPIRFLLGGKQVID